MNRKRFASTGKLLGDWKNLETTIKDGSVLISSLGVTIGEAETMFAARPKMLLNSMPCLSVTLGRSGPRAGSGGILCGEDARIVSTTQNSTSAV